MLSCLTFCSYFPPCRIFFPNLLKREIKYFPNCLLHLFPLTKGKDVIQYYIFLGETFLFDLWMKSLWFYFNWIFIWCLECSPVSKSLAVLVGGFHIASHVPALHPFFRRIVTGNSNTLLTLNFVSVFFWVYLCMFLQIFYNIADAFKILFTNYFCYLQNPL